MPVWQNLRNTRTSFRIQKSKNILVKEFIFVYKTCGLGRFHVIQNWLLTFSLIMYRVPIHSVHWHFWIACRQAVRRKDPQRLHSWVRV